MENHKCTNSIKDYSIDAKMNSFLKWEGRILQQDGIGYLGYTNSSITLRVRGAAVYMYFVTGENEDVNKPGLRVYIDGIQVSEFVLEKEEDWYCICELKDDCEHDVKIVKITEAAMSFAGIQTIRVLDGELIPIDNKDDRVKVEFIGDSITCGYGVHGEPESEYTIREEDGECSYAAYMAKKMNWNARWISASGYGMYVEYTGNPDNNVPKLYPYVNWFVNKDILIQKDEFEPKYIFINLGTNDSGHLENQDILNGFHKAYKDFIKLLRTYHPDAIIICMLGTLCQGIFPYVEQIVEEVKQEGIENVYSVELPYHDVEKDGKASNHPSKVTHQKDAERVLEFMSREGIL